MLPSVGDRRIYQRGLFTSCREGVFPETGLPAAGFSETNFRHTQSSETQGIKRGPGYNSPVRL